MLSESLNNGSPARDIKEEWVRPDAYLHKDLEFDSTETVQHDVIKSSITLTGDTLTIAQVSALVHNQEVKVVFDERVKSTVIQSRTFLDKHLASKVIYGVNTGFGPMASHLIGKGNLVELQYNLIHSHAVGMGQPVPHSFVLAAMLVRLNTLAKGWSGVSFALLEHLQSAINHRIIPVVPEHGAVGTSGDLVQLAHIALGLIGKGQVWFQQKHMAAQQALSLAHMTPYSLKPKEGLSLINGTSFMSGVAALMCSDVDRLLSLATRTGAWALELVGGFEDGIAQRFHEFRPHAGQRAVAQSLRDLLASSQMTKQREEFQAKHRITEATYLIDEEIQEIYSFRCIPQILGPMLESLMQARGIVETEINSVTDNPIVDVEQEQFWHGGHFHGEYIAMISDQLRANLAKLMMLTERRINFFLNNKINKRFAPFLNRNTPGLTLALQGLQFVATSTTAQGQTLAFPHRVHSISTNADNQDVVSMGSDSVLMTMKVIENAYILQAIEMITLAQATDLLDVEKWLSAASQQLYAAIRKKMKTIVEDRVLVSDLPHIVELARTEDNIAVNWGM
jgi:histidine ammonia-lyase